MSDALPNSESTPDPSADLPSTAAPPTTPATSLDTVTPAQADAGLLEPNTFFSPSQLTFSIPTTGSIWQANYDGGSDEPTSPQYGVFSAAQAAQFRTAVGEWGRLIAAPIVETNDLSNIGDIRVAFTNVNGTSSNGDTWGYTYYPPVQGSAVDPVEGDIWVGSDKESSAFAIGSYDFQALLHEFGHALGLKHSFEAPTVPTGYDSFTYTVMSYTGSDYVTTFNETSDQTGYTLHSSTTPTVDSTPMVLDVQAVQDRYGANPNTASGNDTYVFTDAGLGSRQTIYDAGGTDTFDLSHLSRSSYVDLHPGAYSSIDYYPVAQQVADLNAEYPGYGTFISDQLNKSGRPDYTYTSDVGIAFSTVIENIVGSSHGDTLIGNDAANAILGGVGNDVITGGLGSDTLTGGGGSDTFRDGFAGLAGDAITDFNAADVLNVTDASLSSFAFVRSGPALSFGGATTTLSNNPVGHLIVSADASAGVDLTLGAHWAGLQDFGGDGHSDLLWRNTASGTFTTWGVGGNGAAATTEAQNVYVDFSVSNAWQVQGTFDFNGDGQSDILWRNTSSGTFTVWDAGGSGFVQNAYVDGSVDPSWSITGLGDFDGDGRDDLLWRNTDGRLTEWRSTGTGFVSNVFVTQVDPSWHVVGVGDFNGDGRSDILWRNANSATFTEWQSTGSGFTQNVYVDASVDKSWHVEAVADFNGDGKSDLLWRNDNGTFTVWDSTGNGFIQNVYVDGTVSNDWVLQGTGDFNDDGRADLLWRNAVTGVLTVWESTGAGFSHNTLIDASVSNAWTLQAHHYDFV